MKKLTLAIAIAAMTLTPAFANNKAKQIKRIQNLAAEVATLSVLKLASQSKRDLNDIEAALRVSRNILLGINNTRPVEPESYVVCSSNMNIKMTIAANETIKKAADDYMGMNSFSAKDFANAWMNNYPCKFAQEFAQNAKNLNKAADDYMGMNSFSAADYAKDNADKLCPGTDIISVSQQLYKLGQSKGMNSFSAADFVEDEVKRRGLLSCQMPKLKK